MDTQTINIGVYRILRKLGISRNDITPEADIDKDYFFDELDKKMLFNFLEFRYHIELTSKEECKIHKVKHITDIVASKN